MTSQIDKPNEVSKVDEAIENQEAEQFLTFIMDEEEYGVDILSVQEIRGWEPCTPIPNSPYFMKGVMNLRGTIVPIIDLRERFGLKTIEYTPTTVVIVLKLETDKGTRVSGIIVDAVSDVYTLQKKDMKEPPNIGEKMNVSFIKGLINVNDKMVILLELEALVGMDEIENFRELASTVVNTAKIEE